MKQLGCLMMYVLVAGCSLSSGPVVAPSLDPAAMAAEAIREYDADSDGKISSAEAKKSALDPKMGWDKDGDGSITEDELRERLERYEALKPGIQAMTCTVIWRNRPLENAKVVFEPEAFLGEAVEAASGTTDESGVAEMVAEEVACVIPPCAEFVRHCTRSESRTQNKIYPPNTIRKPRCSSS